MTSHTQGSRRNRVGQAWALVETVAPFAETTPGLRPHIETIRRFGAGEFVSKANLLKAASPNAVHFVT